MLSKEELIIKVAESCGVSREISSYFFEIFVNRLSNKLKPGDLLHFQNYGFFHKRNCRIQLGKSSDSDVAKSYLIQLVLFSDDQKIKSDLSNVQFLKISNLKTLWLDDKDFHRSLAAGDFAPHNDRNQLIKSFATTAEVIIASFRKDYDNELVDELIIPLTFDLNFLIKSGQKNVQKTSSTKSETIEDTKAVSKEKTTPIKSAGTEKATEVGTNQKIGKELTESGLPWDYGKKFLEKDKSETLHTPENSNKETEINVDSKKKEIPLKRESDRLKDFEQLSSRISDQKEKIESSDERDTIKFSVKKKFADKEKSEEDKNFTEVKSKTKTFKQKYDFKKSKNLSDDKYFSSSRNNYSRRKLITIVAISTLFGIGVLLTYIFILKDDNVEKEKSLAFNVTPPSTVSVVQRDFEFAVTYPYPKNEARIQVAGINRDGILNNQQSPDQQYPEITKVDKPEIKPERNNKPKEVITEQKTEPVIEKVEEKPVETVKPPEEKSNRIFLYRGFYVVYVGSFNSEEAAEREADKYFDMGYNAYIEAVETSRRTKAYKLNVGDFTSEEFARQFEVKYIK